MVEDQVHCGKTSFEFTAELRTKSKSKTFKIHFSDADGLKSYITRHSFFNPLLKGRSTKNHFYVINNQQMDNIPKDVKHLYFTRYRNEMTILDFSSFGFIHLRAITISSECFMNVREFVLDGLAKLESVKIGEYCIRVSDKERNDGICRIANCPNLTQLEIGNRSFKDFKQFELSNLNSLQSITFGYVCFQYAENCILKGE